MFLILISWDQHHLLVKTWAAAVIVDHNSLSSRRPDLCQQLLRYPSSQTFHDLQQTSQLTSNHFDNLYNNRRSHVSSCQKQWSWCTFCTWSIISQQKYNMRFSAASRDFYCTRPINLITMHCCPLNLRQHVQSLSPFAIPCSILQYQHSFQQFSLHHSQLDRRVLFIIRQVCKQIRSLKVRELRIEILSADNTWLHRYQEFNP